jgi:hypothetical protein
LLCGVCKQGVKLQHERVDVEVTGIRCTLTTKNHHLLRDLRSAPCCGLHFGDVRAQWAVFGKLPLQDERVVQHDCDLVVEVVRDLAGHSPHRAQCTLRRMTARRYAGAQTKQLRSLGTHRDATHDDGELALKRANLHRQNAFPRRVFLQLAKDVALRARVD